MTGHKPGRTPAAIYRLRWRWDESSPWRGPKWFSLFTHANAKAHKLRSFGLQVELIRTRTPEWDVLIAPTPREGAEW